MEPRKHYYLASGQILFVHEDGETKEVGTMHLNALTFGDLPQIAKKDIGKIQVGLQTNFRSRLPDPKNKIIDVVINSISYLGHMTQAEFEAVPEGFELKEKVEASDAPAEPKEGDKPALKVVE